MNWKEGGGIRSGSEHQHSPFADRQSGTSLCISNIAECKRMFQIGDRRTVNADVRSQTGSTRVLPNPFTLSDRPYSGHTQFIGRQTISRVLYSDSCDRGGDHSSRLRVSPKLKRPTRKPGRAVLGAANGATFPYLALLRVGFAKPIRYRTAGALLPHLFTLTGVRPGGMFSVALSVPYGPSSYEAHCPVEFGLSSPAEPAAITRLPAKFL